MRGSWRCCRTPTRTEVNEPAARAPRGAWLARAVIARRWSAGLLAGALLGAVGAVFAAPVLALLGPLLSIAAGAVVALLVLALGSAAAGPLCLGAVVTLVLASGAGPAGALLVLVLHGGVVAALAALLRRSQALSLSLSAAAALATVAALAVTAQLDGSARAERAEQLGAWLSAASGSEAAALQGAVDTAVALSGGALGVALLAGWSMALFCGRSLHARAVAPGAFAAEFRALRLGRVLALVTLVAIAAALLEGLGGRAWGAQLALVGAALYALQGLAVVHALTAARVLWAGSLVLVYAALVLVTAHALMLCAGLGLVDSWADLRARAARARSG